MDVLSEVIDKLYRRVEFTQDGQACQEFQVCWIRQGQGWVSWPDSTVPFPVHGDDIVIASPGTRFWLKPRAGQAHLNLVSLRSQILLHRELPHPLLSILQESGLQVLQHSSIANCFRPIVRELERSKPGHELALKAWGRLLFLTVLRSFHIHRGQRSWLSALRRSSIRPALEAIHRVPEKAWTRESLASEAGRSGGGLYRTFLKWVGMSMTDYLRLWRVHQAAGLLRQGDQSVIQIARNCGYQSRSGLTKAVYHVTGRSLAELRRN